MNSSATALILLAKYPEPGKVKTRLAAGSSSEISIQIYTSCIQDLFQQFQHSNLHIRPYIGDVNTVDLFKAEFCPDIPCYSQSDGDLGQRILSAFDHSFASGYSQAIIMGTDSPDVPNTIIEDACQALSKTDLVLGPTEDGGYYLLGCHAQSLDPSLFYGIEWSTDTVFQDTVEKAKSLGLSMHILPKWQDIDYLSDLKDYYHRNQNSAFQNSHTMNCIKKWAKDLDLEPQYH